MPFWTNILKGLLKPDEHMLAVSFVMHFVVIHPNTNLQQIIFSPAAEHLHSDMHSWKRTQLYSACKIALEVLILLIQLFTKLEKI